MTDMVKTTITIPQDILEKAKLMAVREKISLSKIMRDALEEKVERKRGRKVKNPMKLLGNFSLGIKKIYNKRSDLYDEHLRRKMGL